MLPAEEAIERLREGNRRYVAGLPGRSQLTGPLAREKLVDGQAPFAVILGCSDSRVPAEIVFDQGLGDLFVIRVAGNIAAPSQIGSIEFAADVCGARLVVVLGHTRCGAVAATLDALRRRREGSSEGLRSILKRIQPAVEPLLEGDLASDPVALEREAVRENIRASLRKVTGSSRIIKRLIRDDGLRVVGAEYALETGEVTFLEDA